LPHSVLMVFCRYWLILPPRNVTTYTMNDIELKLSANGRGAFVIEEQHERIAEMEIGIAGSNLTVYHTEVADKLKGQGIAGKLLSTMVDYARAHNLKVIALCPYVLAQFKRHPEQYADVWNQNWH
jgi:predicted GNAT family acetyltransferase